MANMRVDVGDVTYFVTSSAGRKSFWDAVNVGTWEPETFRALNAVLKPESEFIDVGSWIGPLTLFAASRCNKVTAFECDPVAIAELNLNIRSNPELQDHITINEFALGVKSGKATINSRELGNSETSVFNSVSRDGERVDLTDKSEVEIRDASEVFAGLLQGVSSNFVVKIDIEGSEYRVVSRIEEQIRNTDAVWIVSLHEENLGAGHISPHAVQAAETICLLNAFRDHIWYDIDFKPLSKQKTFEDILEGEWKFGQTLIFSAKPLACAAQVGDETRSLPQAGQAYRPLIAPGGEPDQVLIKQSRREGKVSWADGGLAAWKDFHSSLYSSDGSLGEWQTRGKFLRAGKTITFSIEISIVGNGDGFGTLGFDLPLGVPAFASVATGIEVSKTGRSIAGSLYRGVKTCNIRYFDGAYCGFDDAKLIVHGAYELL